MLWQVPTSNSYTWGVDFSERNVVSETFGQFMGLTDTIRSEGFSFKLSLEKAITEMTVYLCLSEDRLKTDDCNNVQLLQMLLSTLHRERMTSETYASPGSMNERDIAFLD